MAGSGYLSSATYTMQAAGISSVTKTKGAALSLNMRYFAIGRLAVGMVGNVSVSSSRTEGAQPISTHSWGVGPSLAWLFGPRGASVLPYVQVAGSWGNFTTNSTSFGGSTSTTSQRIRSYVGSAGVLLMFAPYVGADVVFDYYSQHVTGDSSPPSGGTVYLLPTTDESGVRLRLGLAVFVRP